MPIPIFSYHRYRLKTDTDIFINTDADTDMVLADTNMIEIDTDIWVSANRYIGQSLAGLFRAWQNYEHSSI